MEPGRAMSRAARHLAGASLLTLCLTACVTPAAPAVVQPVIEQPAPPAPPPRRPPVVQPPAPQRAAERPARADPRGQTAIRAANADALAQSRGSAFLNGVQVFAYEPGRIFEVWTTPLRVTTISLRPGERVISKVAGDTVRWMIAETTSGEWAAAQVHIVLKPLRTGLSTNLVVTTSERVYMILLRSAPSAEAANAAVAWEYSLNQIATDVEALIAAEPNARGFARLPIERLDTRYRIEPRGRAPVWTPEAVFDDGAKTYIRFPEAAGVHELPPLFVVSETGEAQLVNYRVRGLTYVVDRLFERAELRLGTRRPQIVRIERAGARS